MMFFIVSNDFVKDIVDSGFDIDVINEKIDYSICNKTNKKIGYLKFPNLVYLKGNDDINNTDEAKAYVLSAMLYTYGSKCNFAKKGYYLVKMKTLENKLGLSEEEIIRLCKELGQSFEMLAVKYKPNKYIHNYIKAVVMDVNKINSILKEKHKKFADNDMEFKPL